MNWIARQGDALVQNLGPGELRLMRLCQWFFHGSMVVPFILFHGACRLHGDPEACVWHGTCKFPATISATVSAGVPKVVQHVLWSVGWALYVTVVARCDTRSRFGLIFAAQMILTGVMALFVFPEGHGAHSDALHQRFATFYFLDHLVLIAYVHQRPRYTRGFNLLLALFGLTTIAVNVCKGSVGAGEAGRSFCSASTVWLWYFLEMFFEYAVMFCFVCGLSSGLEPGQRGTGLKEE